MRAITRTELATLMGDGDGVVLVDRIARGEDRPSTLHAVTCRWVKRTGGRTPLRFARSTREAVLWLNEQRFGEGEGWQRCRECGGVAAASAPGAPPGHAQGQWLWTM